jgi:catechol 2,3-dioxygenase-like lactoylglutathione lyase family enzyme
MSTAETRTGSAIADANVAQVDQKLEVVTLPVSDVDRAKAFYAGLGWRLDADFSEGEKHVVQFTPPGSGTSIHFGTGRTPAAPGSAQGLFLVVSDIQAARAALMERGAQVSDVFHPDGGPLGDPVSGPAPERQSYGSYATFSDPDGNGWLLQEVTMRLPGRIDSAETSYSSAADLAEAMRRASVAHGEHEKRMGGEYDNEWPAWYAAYMVAEQTGVELPQ